MTPFARFVGWPVLLMATALLIGVLIPDALWVSLAIGAVVTVLWMVVSRRVAD